VGIRWAEITELLKLLDEQSTQLASQVHLLQNSVKRIRSMLPLNPKAPASDPLAGMETQIQNLRLAQAHFSKLQRKTLSYLEPSRGKRVKKRDLEALSKIYVELQKAFGWDSPS
jgi:hypothetical protein